jgi:hypothetical protein
MRAALPARFNLCVKAYRVAERHGFVWVSIGEPSGEPGVQALDDSPSVTLRSIVVGAAPERVAEALRVYRQEPAAVLFVQPADAEKAVVHGAVVGTFDVDSARRVRRQHNDALTALRDALESGRDPAPPARNPAHDPQRARAS